jgi:hypothetical protein
MVRNRAFVWMSVVAIIVLLMMLAACAPEAPSMEAPPQEAPAEEAPPQEAPAEEALPQEAPAEEALPQEAPAEKAMAEEGAVPWPAANRVNRMIIKSAELSLLVADTERAIDQVTQVAVDSFGYILSSSTWYEGDHKYATITIGLPSDEYENALRRLRGLAVKVLDENASGSDVTDEYVDLESRLRNLEATEARIRSFLDKAETVEEALRVNYELAAITEEIEQVKGRMNYLKERAAYSTITVHISPDIPTPTVTPTTTATPTTTPTPTPTRIAWRPGETVQSATGVLGSVMRVLGDALIWFTIVLGPFVVVAGLILWLGIGQWRHRSGPGQDKQQDKRD